MKRGDKVEREDNGEDGCKRRRWKWKMKVGNRRKLRKREYIKMVKRMDKSIQMKE